MRVAIMQPYFLPYVGYFQLVGAVDLFILYDNIKYTKKGWINRNRMLQNGKDVMFSLPLKSDSDLLDVRDRQLADDFNRAKLLNRLTSAYRRAPYFPQTSTLLESILNHDDRNLFSFIHHSIARVCQHVGIDTEIRISSEVPIDHALRSQDKVLALCGAVDAKTYINPIGGLDLYSRETFQVQGIELKFLKSRQYEYPQFQLPFVPWLSMVDVLMFNSKDAIRRVLREEMEWM